MKIKITQIDEDSYTIRENVDREALDELKESLKEDGQWDPILVRPVGDKFELIAGHRRVQAAKELGWIDIDANIKQISDVDALFLALKTNLIREGMSEREQGKVLHQITQEFGISSRDLSKRIGKNRVWIDRRIRLAMDLHQRVADALEAGKISMRAAEIIASLPLAPQEPFLLYILQNNITDENEVRAAKKRFLNNTLYTIGYEGKELAPFIQQLKEAGIEYLFDVRFSTESPFKPDFSKPILSRELERAKIKYIHKKELGVPFEWQNPYKEGGIPFECFSKYYRWHLDKEVDFKAIVTEIKESGKSALLCYEKFAKANGQQKITCHRGILADVLVESGEFKEAVHL